LVIQVQNKFNKVEILFVNAGIFIPIPVGQIGESAYNHQIDINLKGAIFTTEKFLSILNEGALIINLSSINAYIGIPNTAVYAASKAGLNAYTRTAANELAPKAIRINSVNPGPIATSILAKLGCQKDN
jgi:NAD(P)-dependent dehydrogenase (short-subunit alcohol dehydrogenase family)